MKTIPAWRIAFPEIYCSPKVDFFHLFGNERGNGCVALNDIEEGELLLSVPFDDCVWPSDGDEDIEIRLLRTIASKLEANDRFSDYIRASVVAASSSLVRIAEGTLSSYENLFHATVDPLLADFERDLVALLLSRCFASDAAGIAAVPLADQFNHSTLSWNTRLREDIEGRKFFFISERKIFKGEKVLNYYGIDNTVEMQVTHGFVDEGLCDSLIVFPMALMKETFGKLENDDVLVKIDVEGDSVIPEDLLKAMPLLCFVPALVEGLVRCMNRMINSMEGRELHPLVKKDLSNCVTYKNRLIDYSVSLSR